MGGSSFSNTVVGNFGTRLLEADVPNGGGCQAKSVTATTVRGSTGTLPVGGCSANFGIADEGGNSAWLQQCSSDGDCATLGSGSTCTGYSGSRFCSDCNAEVAIHLV